MAKQNGRWPHPDSRLSDWLDQLQAGGEYTLHDLTEITGAGSDSTLRTIILRLEVPREAQPRKVRGRARVWDADGAREFLKMVAQQIHLPDAFGEPMLMARDVAALLGLSYDALKQGVFRGSYPPPVIAARGSTGGLWREADILAYLEGSYEPRNHPAAANRPKVTA